MRFRLALFVLGVLTVLAVPAQTANPPEVRGIIFHEDKYLAQIITNPFPPRPEPSPSTTPSASSSAAPVTSTPSAAPTSTVSTPAVVPTTSTQTRARVTTSTALSSIATTSISSASPTPTEKSDGGDNNQGLIVAGSAIGGLVFAIGIAIISFKIIVARKERQQRQKEFAAALSDSYYPGGAANALTGGGSSGYRELHDDTAGLRDGGANLSRHESYSSGHGTQPYYYKESGYSQPYVQERYGGNNGTYGMYEETEMSVIGGGNHGPAYPPASMRHREDYDYGYGQQPPAYGNSYGGGYDNYSYGASGKGNSGY
ncbi:hypothetical protein BGW41_002838 [Actinomortierella wolfii]|nr:hypothetical protein BGW41_002838 [Actinomortierella wolfii]